MKTKPPAFINYYGGKYGLMNWIIGNFPSDYEKMHYVEPFAGGLSVFFHKKKSKLESINDLDLNIYLLYKTFRDNKEEFEKRIKNSLYHEEELRRSCRVVKRIEDPIDEIDFAICVFQVFNMSFGGTFCGGFAYVIDASLGRALKSASFNNKSNFFDFFYNRLKKTQIFNRDIIEIIHKLDSKETLFYLDPPYPEADQKYKQRFSNEEFNKLVDKLKNIKGKFLLSCYELEWMDFDKSWNKLYKDTICRMSKNKKSLDDSRTELLVTNYSKSEKEQPDLI